MTQTKDDEEVAKQSSAERIRRIQTTFDEILEIIHVMKSEYGPLNKEMSKTIITKLGELQTVHINLQKAEEAFHDKFGDGDEARVVDHDAIRRELGRKLDRIRDTGGARSIPEIAEPATD